MNERSTIFSPCRKWRYTLWREWDKESDSSPCHSSSDGECVWDKCPQLRDNEPEKSGRHCPMDGPNCYVQFIGLNPSTADETQDDPTIRRCIQFAKDWGYGALCMTNLFAWRDTLPENMKKASDPIGADNDEHLKRICAGAGIVIAAWGKHGSHLYRAVRFKALAREWGVKLHCLKLNGDGSPQHPLYIKGDTKPMEF